MIRYVVTITGDRAPYKWQVKRLHDGNTQTLLVCSGEADGVQDAMFQANAGAHEAEEKRRYAATTRTEELFAVEADEKPQELVPDCIDFVD